MATEPATPGTSQDHTPYTHDALAANGHIMTYRVTGTDPDTGQPITSQWDAAHADTCPCRTAEDPEPLPDW